MKTFGHFTDSEMDAIVGTQPWPHPVPIHGTPSCGGPCNQGRSACPAPQACIRPAAENEPDYGPRWGVLALLASAALVIGALAYFVK